jgi:Zn-dependent M28 family amino/carboxypeptidase
VPLVGVKTLPETSFALVPSSGEPLVLRNLDDFVTSNETQTASAEIDAPIVFVGYGITAPEEKWDDYKGYDLKGKVALLFVNEPISDDPNFFKGKALTYNGRWTYKFEETARRGAVATLIIHRTDLASYGWEVVRNSWGGERSYLKLDGTPKLEAASWIQEEVARKLVGMAGLDLDKLFQQAQSREFKPIELPVHLKAHVVSALRSFSSRNVLGMVEGSYDSEQRGEAVVYTAHYDHFGIDRAKPDGANIYHGAVDNGSGCGILLEIARAWGATKPMPPRSVLLAAVTGEEQGLLGSEYLGKHSLELPVDPILDLNYDALAPIGIPEEVEVSGAERTTFYPTVEKVARTRIPKRGITTARIISACRAWVFHRSPLGRAGSSRGTIWRGARRKPRITWTTVTTSPPMCSARTGTLQGWRRWRVLVTRWGKPRRNARIFVGCPEMSLRKLGRNINLELLIPKRCSRGIPNLSSLTLSLLSTRCSLGKPESAEP